MADRAYLERLTRELADQGKLIEAGWVGLRLLMHPETSPAQLDAMRTAYFSGAHHLWASLMNTLEPGVMETPTDLRRMDLIHQELEAWDKEFRLKMAQSKGSE